MRLIYENRLEQQLKEGLEQAEKQGLEQGLDLKAQEMARAMKADNEPVEKIAKYTGLSIKEIEALE